MVSIDKIRATLVGEDIAILAAIDPSAFKFIGFAKITNDRFFRTPTGHIIVTDYKGTILSVNEGN